MTKEQSNKLARLLDVTEQLGRTRQLIASVNGGALKNPSNWKEEYLEPTERELARWQERARLEFESFLSD